MSQKIVRLSFVLITLITFISTGFAETPSGGSTRAPNQLAEWRDWVTGRHPSLECPIVNGEGVCIWPTSLRLNIGANTGDFTQTVELLGDGMLELPGGADLPPSSLVVRSESGEFNRSATLGQEGYFLSLNKGSYQISGSFKWQEIPQIIKVPRGAALLSVTLEGRPIDSIRINERSELSLRDRQSASELEQNSISVALFRRIKDERPLVFDTLINLKVSGGVRDVNLGRVLPDGIIPIDVASSLNVRSSNSGEFEVQLKPGSHYLEIRGVVSGNLTQLTVPAGKIREWPESEVWSFSPREDLRSVEINGAVAIDPDLADVPSEWRGTSHFSLNSGSILGLTVSRRGEEADSSNAINLTRELWLRLNGEGFAVRDSWSGTMNREWRLDALDSLKLGQVKVGDQGQLITVNPSNNLSGVELREQNINMLAEGEVNSVSRLKAVGWNHDANSLSIVLNLPPGWRSWFISGADTVVGSWTESWTLLDLFLVMLFSAATYKLFGVRVGLLAFLVQLLLHGESGAPQSLWGFALLGVALSRYLPEGALKRFGRIYGTLVALILIFVALNFIVSTVRGGLFPQLEDVQSSGRSDFTLSRPLAVPASSPVGGAQEVEYPTMQESKSLMSDMSIDGTITNYLGKRSRNQIVDPNAVVQNAPGVPNWSWRRVYLEWSGAVNRDHEVVVCLSGPITNLILALLRVLGLSGLLFVVLGELFSIKVKLGAVVAPVIMILLAPSFISSGSAEAQAFPSQEMLAEYESRLLADRCVQGCVSLGSSIIQVSDRAVKFETNADTIKGGAVALPGPTSVLRISRVEVDGAPAQYLRRDESGYIWVRLTPGSHKLSLVGDLQGGVALTLQFPANPGALSVKAPDWQVDGVTESGAVNGSIQLLRASAKDESTAPKSDPSGVTLPNWYVVDREISLGVDWGVSTTVKRMGSLEFPSSIVIPSLVGESVIAEGMRVDNSGVQVQFLRGQDSVSWRGVLGKSDKLELVSAQNSLYSEEWIVNCSSIFSCSADGVPATYSISGGEHQFKWHPYSGERVVVAVSRPQGVSGSTISVDEVTYNAIPGVRIFKGFLSFNLRSSQGGSYKIQLPAGSKISDFMIDNESRSYTMQDDSLLFSLKNGVQFISLNFQIDDWVGGLVTRLPKVTLSSPASNVVVSAAIPSSTWLIWLSGPGWGGDVLFWIKVLVIALGAAALSRVKIVPLNFASWFLLGAGFATSSVLVMLIPVIWFFLFAIRASRPSKSWWRFNLSQLVLVIYTLITVIALYSGISTGLLFDPDMKVAGFGSTGDHVRWYADIVSGELPIPVIYTLPIWVWRGLMLLWSGWLVLASLRWARWGFDAFRSGGIWRPRVRIEKSNS